MASRHPGKRNTNDSAMTPNEIIEWIRDETLRRFGEGVQEEAIPASKQVLLDAINEACTAEREAIKRELDGLKNRCHWLSHERDELLKLSSMLEEHPEEYDGPCLCHSCQVNAQ